MSTPYASGPAAVDELDKLELDDGELLDDEDELDKLLELLPAPLELDEDGSVGSVGDTQPVTMSAPAAAAGTCRDHDDVI